MSGPVQERDNIALCGFMGCGKSTVGQALAALLGAPFADTDALVERDAGMPVREIFARFGEARFRALETRAIESLPRRTGLVVGIGGGAALYPCNVAALRAGGRIVLIDVPAAVIETRLLADTTRPLLNTPDRAQRLRRLYAERLPLYRVAADFAVTGGEAPAESVARAILRRLGLSTSENNF